MWVGIVSSSSHRIELSSPLSLESTTFSTLPVSLLHSSQAWYFWSFGKISERNFLLRLFSYTSRAWLDVYENLREEFPVAAFFVYVKRCPCYYWRLGYPAGVWQHCCKQGVFAFVGHHPVPVLGRHQASQFSLCCLHVEMSQDNCVEAAIPEPLVLVFVRAWYGECVPAHCSPVCQENLSGCFCHRLFFARPVHHAGLTWLPVINFSP